MMKSLQGKFLLFFMFALILNIFRINMAYSDDARSSVETDQAKAQREIASEKEEIAKDAEREAKKAQRKASDKECKMVKGQWKCTGQQLKHSTQNAADKMEDVID